MIVIADEVDEGIELVHALSASAAEEGACTTPVGDSAGRLDVPARRAAA